MEVFDWAIQGEGQGGDRNPPDTCFDYDGLLPVFAVVTEGETHGVIAARGISFPSGSVLLMDRGYLDYGLLFDLDSGVFRHRTKATTAYTVEKTHEIPDNKDIVANLTVKFSGQQAGKKYGKPLRVVRFEDPDTGKSLEFITQQLRVGSKHNRDALQTALDDRDFLQAAQTASEDQIVRRDLGKRSDDSKIGRP